ncbi:AraC family transcriptional regulator [Kribbella sp. NPDC051586]|uniref:AraC family transcriptional regulator n=1 Tax=Kribbella sp. NPDC051586 TaxID=3364118 RepID=UPI0037B641D8
MRAVFEHVAEPDEISWHHHVRHGAAFDFHWHFHPQVELTLITKGSGTRIVGDSIENYWPGDLTLIGADVPHTYASGADSAEHEAVVVQFRPDFLGAEFWDRPEFVTIGGLLAAAAGGLNLAADDGIEAAMRELAVGGPAERTLRLLGLLSRLADHAPRILSTATVHRPVGAPARERADAVHTYLSANYTTPIRLGDVAAVAHLTPTAFSRFFRRTFGRTLTDYVNELRVAAACRLLGDTDLAIADIAARVGYENLANFNRRFRELKGTNPRDYRRTLNGDQGNGSEPAFRSRPMPDGASRVSSL